MKKILVTTDYSENSKAGLYFAIQLSTQFEFKLTFFNVHYAPTPTSWDAARLKKYEENEQAEAQQKLSNFVESLYADIKIPAVNIECVVKVSVLPEPEIREYAVQHQFDFICISTRGAGKFERLLGTNTGNLINHSEVPIIAVPPNYTMLPITSVLYASDLGDYKIEIPKVVAFAQPINAAIELLHLKSAFEHNDEIEATKNAIKEIAAYHIEFNIKDRNPDASLVTDIETAIDNRKPSMMIMFTNQNRSWFDKIFLSSKSAEYSFNAKVPLLVFSKA
jgi:nucleotide-binding universal stress UspA family protein